MSDRAGRAAGYAAGRAGGPADPPARGAAEHDDPGGDPGGGGDGNALERLLDAVDRRQQGIVPVAFAYGVVRKFGDDRAGERAALVAYYAFFSVFPLLLLFVTVLGYVLDGNPDLRDEIVDSAVGSIPVLGEELARNVGTIGGSGVAVVVGAVGALWAGLGVANTAQSAMNEVWDVPRRERPGFAPRLARSVAVLALLGVGVVVSAFVGQVPRIVGASGVVVPLAFTALSALLNTAVAAVAFRVLTDAPLHGRRLWPGAVVAGLAYTALQLVGGWYLNRVVAGAGDTYGTFAVVIGLLTWFYLLGQVSLLAAEVNVVAGRRLWPRSLTGRLPTEADRRAADLARSQAELLPG